MTTETCVHEWQIQPPDGPTSSGTCQLCHETREFLNHIDTENWKEKGVKSKAAKKAQAEMLEGQKEYVADHIGLHFTQEN